MSEIVTAKFPGFLICVLVPVPSSESAILRTSEAKPMTSTFDVNEISPVVLLLRSIKLLAATVVAAPPVVASELISKLILLPVPLSPAVESISLSNLERHQQLSHCQPM